jgi:hypothetical protein
LIEGVVQVAESVPDLGPGTPPDPSRIMIIQVLDQDHRCG